MFTCVYALLLNSKIKIILYGVAVVSKTACVTVSMKNVVVDSSDSRESVKILFLQQMLSNLSRPVGWHFHSLVPIVNIRERSIEIAVSRSVLENQSQR